MTQFSFERFIYLPQQDAIMRQHFGSEIPYLGDLIKTTSLMFINAHFSLSGPRPNSPEVIELGGIHIRDPPKPLDSELQRILDSAEHGVIYVSWGSIIQAATLPEDKRDTLLRAFGSLKQTVLWKFENISLENRPENLVIRKWLPQQEILGETGEVA